MTHDQYRPLIDYLQARYELIAAMIKALETGESLKPLGAGEQHASGTHDREDHERLLHASRSQLGIELNRLQAALARALTGSYGICCRCNLPVEDAHLIREPAAALCQECLDELAEDRERVKRLSIGR